MSEKYCPRRRRDAEITPIWGTMSETRLGFGIIGCGMIADWHAAAIRKIPDTGLVCAADIDERSRTRFHQTHGIPVYDSPEALLRVPSVDIVCVCVPSGLHAQYAVQCANAGKHIMLEKPMAITLPQADEIIDACEKNNVKLTVISQFRFTPAAVSLKQAVDAGLLGKLLLGDLSMKFHRSQEYYDRSGWRGTWKMDGGGALMNQGVHGIDLLQSILGPVKSVSAHARTLVRNIETEDTAVAAVEFTNGALGVIQGTTSVYPGFPRRLEVNGSGGTIVLEEDAIVRWQVEGRRPPEGLVAPSATFDSSSDPTAIGFEGHLLQLSDMADAVRNGREPLINQHEGRKAIEIILAIYESSEKRRPVYLNAGI
jgi:UDP-N-acetyl-2-amino-2-deoxyglucuronate dehydrogenase